MNIYPQDCHTLQKILDTHVILDRKVKEEIVMQEENNSIKNDYLPTNMTVNVNVEEVIAQNLSIDEAEGGTKPFNLTMGEILSQNDVKGSTGVYYQIRQDFYGRKHFDTK